MDFALSKSESVFLISFNSLQIIIGSLSNCIVIITFMGVKELRRRPSDLLILNLAVADLIFLTTFLPWLTYIVSKTSVEHGYFVYESSNTFVQLSSGNTILVIAIDRFIAVVFPLRYKSVVTRRTIYIMIALSWISAAVVAILNFLAFWFKFHYQFVAFWISSNLFLILVITLLYSIIFTLTLKQGRKILKQRRNIQIESEDVSYRLVMKITWNTFILVCLFYATFLPVVIYIGHASLVMKQKNVEQLATRCWIYSFAPVNCCIDPFVYALRTKKFKQAFYRNICNTFDHPIFTER